MNFIERLHSYFPPRDVEIYFAVQGGRTGHPRTLSNTAAEFGLSAERVRQITSNIEASVRFLDLPEAAAFRAMLERLTPVRAADLQVEMNREFHDLGLTAVGFFRILSSIDQVGPFQLGVIEQGGEGVVPVFVRATASSVEAVFAQVRRIARASGAVSPASIRTAYPQGPWDAISIERLLPVLPGLRRIAGTEDWYWIQGVDATPIRKLKAYLSKAGRLSCEECLSGDLIFGESETCIRPPLEVFRALLAHHDIEVAGDRMVNVVSRARSTSGTTKADNCKVRMIDLLRTHDVPMRTREFFDACEKSGISPNTARIYMYRYNALFKIKDGHVALCAACAPP